MEYSKTHWIFLFYLCESGAYHCHLVHLSPKCHNTDYKHRVKETCYYKTNIFEAQFVKHLFRFIPIKITTSKRKLKRFHSKNKFWNSWLNNVNQLLYSRSSWAFWKINMLIDKNIHSTMKIFFRWPRDPFCMQHVIALWFLININGNLSIVFLICQVILIMNLCSSSNLHITVKSVK